MIPDVRPREDAGSRANREHEQSVAEAGGSRHWRWPPCWQAGRKGPRLIVAGNAMSAILPAQSLVFAVDAGRFRERQGAGDDRHAMPVNSTPLAHTGRREYRAVELGDALIFGDDGLSHARL